MRGKRSKSAISFYVLIAVVVVLIIAGYLSKQNIAVLKPAGTVARQERSLMFVALGLCSLVIIPVFTLATFISLKYREGNKRPKKYSPNWDGNRLIESIWWAIPMTIITILAVITWKTSYSLDPYKALASQNLPINIQVVALDWKWLFIYPSQEVAAVNSLYLPVNTPVNFYITSDSVMNSFWIPNLGSQIYAMPGMNSQLHLSAYKLGAFRGSSANISGRGFASMNFIATVASQSDFNSWVRQAKTSPKHLNTRTYQRLAMPSQNVRVTTYSDVQPYLYDQVVNSYAGPLGRPHGGH